MARDSIVPTDSGVVAVKHISENVEDLIAQARAADEADQKLTLREAIKHYKKAVFWAIILSTSLIMEGYDLVIV
jgi:SP family general alpha glucoside:H+ symporter-like MFS transporter